MTQYPLFTLNGASEFDPAVAEYLSGEPAPLTAIARHWFAVIRSCGDDVFEVMHDGCPTACIGDAALAYVAVFSKHVNIGFFTGADLPDPSGLLLGTGKRMRHVRLAVGEQADEAALRRLIAAAYQDIKRRREEAD